MEAVKSLFVEKELIYTLLNMDLSIHEVKENGKYMMKASIHGKFPVTLFGDKYQGRSEYIAILTRDGRGITIINNAVDGKFKILTVKENLHEMIVNSLKGTGDVLFSADYAGNVVKTQVVGNDLKIVGSLITGSGCANCLEVLDDKTIYVGSIDGSIKKIVFSR